MTDALSPENRALRQRVMLGLAWADQASCTCNTKSPDPQYHTEDCKHRVIMEAIAALEELVPVARKEASASLKAEVERLTKQVEANRKALNGQLATIRDVQARRDALLEACRPFVAALNGTEGSHTMALHDNAAPIDYLPLWNFRALRDACTRSEG